MFHRSRVTYALIFNSEGQRSGGRPHNMSALGQRGFLVLDHG